MSNDRLKQLEAELLACFNEQQHDEGFTVSDDSDEIYQAKDGNDPLFKYWVSDCRLSEAIEYLEILEVKLC
jgi:hypothetical protein